MKNNGFPYLLLMLFATSSKVSFCQECTAALGMESGAIEDSQLTAAQGVTSRSAIYSRYNTGSGWCTVGGLDYKPGSFNGNYYLQLDLLRTYTVTSIAIQGKKDDVIYSYGSKIQIQFKSVSSLFQYYMDSQGSNTLQTKDLRNNTPERIVFNPPLCARYLRYLPFISENPKCIRFEVYGCAGCSNPTQGTPKDTTTLKFTKEKTRTSTTMRSTPTTTLTDGPSGGSSTGLSVVYIVVIVIVLLMLLIIIIAVCCYRHRIRHWCKNRKDGYKNRRSDKQKFIKKKKKQHFQVQYDVKFTDETNNEENGEGRSLMLCEASIQKTEPNSNQETVNYSDVYAAPIINSDTNYTEVEAGSGHETANQYDAIGDNQEEHMYAPPVLQPNSDSMLRSNDGLEQNPIYAGSQIYDNPFQNVTGSSLYADPNILGDKKHIDIINIPRNKLQFMELIGEGQFGEVYICQVEGLVSLVGGHKRYSQLNSGVNKVAVKVLKAGTDHSVEEEFMKEVRVMARLEHENVVQLLGVCYEDPKCMVVEFLENGDLMQFLQGYKRYEGPPEPKHSDIPKDVLVNDTLLYIAMQIAAGMNYLSTQGFVHRDLATRNCLVGHSYTVKIADFGMSRNLYSKQYYRIEGKAVLPIRWMAPESLYYGTFTSHSDIWAFAVTVWEIFMFVREQPYGHLTDQQVIENACIYIQDKSKAFRYLSKPIGCPDDVYSMMLRCWQKAPETRPEFTNMLEFFKSQTRESVEVEI